MNLYKLKLDRSDIDPIEVITFGKDEEEARQRASDYVEEYAEVYYMEWVVELIDGKVYLL